MSDGNGRLKLTWGQVTWALAVLVAIISAWFDLRYQVRESNDLGRQAMARIAALEQRNLVVGFTRQDADDMADSLLFAQQKGRRQVLSRLADIDAAIDELKAERHR